MKPQCLGCQRPVLDKEQRYKWLSGFVHLKCYQVWERINEAIVAGGQLVPE